jgi:ATP adenylyltransferase
VIFNRERMLAAMGCICGPVAAEMGQSKVLSKYSLRRFEEGLKGVPLSRLIEVYMEMLAWCTEALILKEGEICPHKVVLWDNCVVVIPRRRGTWEGASANTAGMMKSVWMHGQS